MPASTGATKEIICSTLASSSGMPLDRKNRKRYPFAVNMILQTNVKLNLGLEVLRKRPDGFHDIETLFVPCHEFGDTLEVITGDDYSRTSASLFARYSTSLAPEEQPALGRTQPQRAKRSENGRGRARTAPRTKRSRKRCCG